MCDFTDFLFLTEAFIFTDPLTGRAVTLVGMVLDILG